MPRSLLAKGYVAWCCGRPQPNVAMMQASSYRDGLKTTLFLLTLLSTLATGHGNADDTGYECQHNRFANPLTHVRLPTVSERRMHAEAAAPWRPLRMVFNWTFVDHPELDVNPDGGVEPQACYSGGPSTINYPLNPTQPWTQYCFDTAGNQVATINCLLRCDSSSIATAADVQSLKTMATAVAQQFQNALYAQIVDSSDAFTIMSTALQSCGGLRFGPLTVTGIDIVIFATLRPIYAMSGVVAFATPCDVHKTSSRPILGHMNVDPITIKTNSALPKVLLHELTHALGFTTAMYSYYRHPSDNTKTYVQYDATAYPTGPISGAGAYVSGGVAKFDYSQLVAGKKAWMITPNVVQFSRDYYNCSTLVGAELENGGNSSASTGTHWERRTLFYEYMAAMQSSDMTFSGFTLALFADMGFYQVNMSQAQNMTYLKHKGCSWINGKCSVWSGQYFCTAATNGCSYNYQWVGSCDYRTQVQNTPIPSAFQYFGDDHTGGDDRFGDYCPTYQQFSTPKYCNVASSQTSDDLKGGTLSTVASQCFQSSVVALLYDPSSATLGPGCNPMLCNSSDLTSAVVRVGDGFFRCTDSLVFSLRYPPQAATQNSAYSNYAAVNFISFSYHGTFQCGADISSRCADVSSSGLFTTAQLAFPSITSVVPAIADVLGGTTITINGTNLLACNDIQVGGAFVQGVKHIGTTSMTGVVTAVTGVNGGSNGDRTGLVDVALWCNITLLCPEGCEVGRLINGIKLASIPPATVDLASSIQDFLNTTLGKVVGAAVAIVCLALLACLLKQCCCSADDGGGGGGGRGRHSSEYEREIEMQKPLHYSGMVRRRPAFDDDNL